MAEGGPSCGTSSIKSPQSLSWPSNTKLKMARGQESTLKMDREDKHLQIKCNQHFDLKNKGQSASF